MRNPARRNRNIGQAWSGHSESNRFSIPERWSSREVFWLTLHQPVRVVEGDVTFWVEPPHPGQLHHASIDDILRVLRRLPIDDTNEIRTLVLRQPTRKQRTLSAVWGRLAYFSNLADGSPVVVLEAQDETTLRWPHRLDLDSSAELDRLAADGHRLERTRRHWLVHRSAASNRATQLYRSLVHEVGHYVQYLNEVLIGDGEGFQERSERFFAKPPREREAFAHQYADRMAPRIERFAPLLDAATSLARGVPPSWFAQAST